MAKHRGSATGPVVMNAANRTYGTRYELASEFQGDGATGANQAYGNAPRTSGMVMTRTRVGGHGDYSQK
ncbi:MAG TPA: hypothetical protein VNT75_10400 [Symbiobacteriaceae bacterium]|nr:hypothetical protein [Symbiobacteriaceae bacterium]